MNTYSTCAAARIACLIVTRLTPPRHTLFDGPTTSKSAECRRLLMLAVDRAPTVGTSLSVIEISASEASAAPGEGAAAACGSAAAVGAAAGA